MDKVACGVLIAHLGLQVGTICRWTARRPMRAHVVGGPPESRLAGPDTWVRTGEVPQCREQE